MSAENLPVRRLGDWGQPLGWWWRLLTRPQLTVALLVWLAVIVAFSQLVPQFPRHVEDPLVRSQWLSGIPAAIWPLVERLEPLGIFNLLGSVWLRLPLVLLLAHALVVVVHRSAWAWRSVRWLAAQAATEPWLSSQAEADGLIRVNLSCRSQGSVTDEDLARRLAGAGYRVRRQPDSAGLCAWRNRWSWWAAPGCYAGLALMAMGVILSSWLLQAQEISLEPGHVVSVPGLGDLRLEQVTAGDQTSVVPDEGEIELQVIAGAQEGQPLRLRLHSSHLWRGAWLTARGIEPMAEVSAFDPDTGEQLLLQPFGSHAPSQLTVRLPLAQSLDTRFVGVPACNVTLRVDYLPVSSDRPAPSFVISFFRGTADNPQLVTAVADGETAQFDGVHYRLRLGHLAHLQVLSGLWWLLVALGWAITLLGLGWLAIAPPVLLIAQATAGTEGGEPVLTASALGEEHALYRQLMAICATPTGQRT